MVGDYVYVSGKNCNYHNHILCEQECECMNVPHALRFW